MQEKKTEMANKKPKKANLLDHHSIKHILDESVSEIVTSRGYEEDVRMSNIRLFFGTIIIVIALFAQFYNKKFPQNREFLIGCIYIVFNGLLQLIIHLKEKNAILVTYPPKGSFTSTGLVVSSKLPRFSDEYTLTIDQFLQGNQFSLPKASPSASPRMEFWWRACSGKMLRL
uniref:Signal peptidase complex subunit 2 n=1 Tax=Populus trichocarpa TaxID=3694 RepID=A0A2K1YWR8_POPTR